jgi:hypothetical protein
MPAPSSSSVRDDQALERIIREGNRSRDLSKLRARADSPWWWNWLCLADGSRLSVIAGSGAYCAPADGGPYVAVEVWWPGDEDPTPQVLVDDVRKYASDHGGVVGVAATEEAARKLAKQRSRPLPPILREPGESRYEMFALAPEGRGGWPIDSRRAREMEDKGCRLFSRQVTTTDWGEVTTRVADDRAEASS